ncbi:MAG: prepilin-type N-terminal cleavage/methylation domain-containing protein [Candidatus Saccharibacteria bacterium]|nr:prepilin-type N-terminal cleavage/methylation domain-containing protein [Candidatus Saccharibacteria bacterium]
MKNKSGFTIVELLIVIVIIGILAALVITAYNGIQQRARDAKRLSDIRAVARIVESYYSEKGSYPTTGGLSNGFALSDANCNDASTHTSDWVPGVVPSFVNSLPQSDGPRTSTYTRCYKYISDGTNYVLSAWLAVETGPQTSTSYRNLGFREPVWSSSEGYYCGNITTPAGYWYGFYQYSYTVSSIKTCNGGT